MRAARTPPEPAPMTKRSTSWSAISCYRPIFPKPVGRRSNRHWSKGVAFFLQFLAHLCHHLVGERVRPILREFQTVIDDLWLLDDQLFSGRRFVECEQFLELLFGKVNRINPD